MLGRKQSQSKSLPVIFLAVSLCTVLLLCSAEAEAQEPDSPIKKISDLDIQVGASADLYGKYIWRGQTLVDEPVIQPGAYLSVKGFTASIWGNFTLTDDKEWTELDYTLDYTTSLGFVNSELEKLSVSVGYIYYDFPNLSAGDDSQEIYAGIAADTLLSPSFTVYYDYDEGDGVYYELTVGHSLPVDKASLDLSASIGYNDGQWDYDSSFSSANFGAAFTIPLTERLSFAPGVYYSLALDNQYDNEIYAGFSFAFEL